MSPGSPALHLAGAGRKVTVVEHPHRRPPTSRRHRLLDAVLLDVLDRDPAQLERAFARLFSANPAERVLRFLDEDSTVRDELRLIASLPPTPYLRGVVRWLGSWR